MGRSPIPSSRRARVAALLLANVLALTVVVAWPDPAPARWSVAAQARPDDAVTAIAARHVHGWFDDALTTRQMSETALARPIYATCGPVSMWAVDLLEEAGIRARLVMVLTLDEWNDSDNGHTFIEVREGGRWVAYDIDRKVRWTDEAGRGLSMVDWIARVGVGHYRIVPLLGRVDEVELRRQDRRYAQVPFVRAGGRLWFPSQGVRDAAILGYSRDYRVLPRADWRARFVDVAT